MKRFLLFFLVLVSFIEARAALAYVNVSDGVSEESRVGIFVFEMEKGEIIYEKADFSFQSLGFDDFSGLDVRFFVDGLWGEWQALGVDEPGYGAFSSLVFTSPTQQFSIRSRLHRSVTVHAFWNWIPSLATAALSGVSAERFSVIPRALWGADEQLRVDKSANKEHEIGESGEGKDSTSICDPIEQKFIHQFTVERTVETNDSGEVLKWPQEYSEKVKKVVVHHTAGNMKDINADGNIDATDYALAVKNIYTYHTVTKGWGDVGYNYLVDPEGNVYEGRAGGDKVVGGHVLCQNTSTVGIAVLGNYETTTVNRNAFMGLARIVQQQSKKYGVNPKGMSTFRGLVLPHVLGHRDLAAVTKAEIGRGGTTCPGKNLEGMLNRLRTVVASGSFNGSELGFIPYKDYDYQLADDVKKLEMKPASENMVTIRLQNIGLKTWKNARLVFQQRPISVATDALIPMKEKTIATGGVAEFEVPIRSSLAGGVTRVPFQLYADNEKMEGLLVLPVVVEKPVFSYDLLSTKGFTGPFLIGEKRDVSVTIANTSNFMWKASGDVALTLKPVRILGSRVLVDRRGKSRTLVSDVAIGSSATFTWREELPARKGAVQLQFVPTIGAGKGLKGESIGGRLIVEEPRIDSRVVLRERISFLSPGEEISIPLRITNVGNFSWEAESIYLRLDDNDTIIAPAADFRQNTKILQQEVSHRSIDIGNSLDVDRIIRAPYRGNVFLVDGALRSDVYQNTFFEFQKRFLVRGRAIFKGKKVGQSTIKLHSDSGFEKVFVEYENTGNVPWYNWGKGAIELVVEDIPHFADTSWVNRKKVGTMVQNKVGVGEVARFEFTLRLPGRVIRPVEDVFGIRVDGKKVLGARSARFEVSRVRGERSSFGNKGDIFGDVNDQLSITNDQLFYQEVDSDDQDVPMVRVLISSFDGSFAEISSPGKMKVWRSSDGSVEEVEGSVVVDASKMSADDVVRIRAVDGEYLEFENWDRIPSWSTSGAINDNSFRTVLEFRVAPQTSLSGETGHLPLLGESLNSSEQSRLMVINELSLENYMKGISEEPESDDLPQEKRKVIAVLARSYALHYISSNFEKFPGKPYNASDDPAVFQKYSGYGFEVRSPKWQQALRDTAREVLRIINPPAPLQGELNSVLRAAYFSCSDGNTKTPEEARFGMDYFSLVSEVYQSVPDPLGNDPVRSSAGQCGHGVGLSGLGATEKARNGQNYRDIIDYYYQNVEVGKY